MTHLLGVSLDLPGQLFGPLLLLLQSLHQSVLLLLQRSHPGAQSHFLTGFILQGFLKEERIRSSLTRPNSLDFPLMESKSFYLCVIELALQAADLFSQTEGLGVGGGQTAGDRLDLTLETETDEEHEDHTADHIAVTFKTVLISRMPNF